MLGFKVQSKAVKDCHKAACDQLPSEWFQSLELEQDIRGRMIFSILVIAELSRPHPDAPNTQIHTPKTAAADTRRSLPDVWFLAWQLEMPKSKCPQKQHLAMEDGETVDKHTNSLVF